MASAARGESSNPYGGGLGTGGKFRKPTIRRLPKTPYERPTTAVRNGGLGRGNSGGEGHGGGWLSKLVDPAQRLITYSAHKLFASVFRKRLTPADMPLQTPELQHEDQQQHQEQQQQLPKTNVNQETEGGRVENISALSMPDLIRIDDTNAPVDPTKDGFTDLEKILKEKTFTRSEVDRLTSLLRSRSSVSSTVNEGKRNEVSIVRYQLSHERDRAHPENGSMSNLVSTPLESSRALDECIASPAQLAKAYMGSRPSEVSPSMLGSRGQQVREESVFLNKTPFLPMSPTMSLVPRSSGQKWPLENGFVTPRSRGRSAVYSMARTPYSRPQSGKIGSLFQASPSTWDESLPSGSRQGFQTGLKRRSSVLNNDIGSVGPVRRIRQKSNLSSRSLALAISDSPLSVRASGEQNITPTSKDSAEVRGSSFNLVPSKSSETASKIFQQLDKMVSLREKSPSKLSPSMLTGPALKSLQNLEAPKFLDNLPEKKENLPSSSYQKQDKSRESGSREVLALGEKTDGAVGGISKTTSYKNKEASVEGTYMPVTSSLEAHPPKKRAFRMAADEDFLELDDGKYAGEKLNSFKVEKAVAISMPKGEKPPASSEAMPSVPYISNGDASQGISNGALETGRSKMPSEPTSRFTQGTQQWSSSPGMLTSEEKVNSLEEPRKAAAVFPNVFSSGVTDLLNQNAGVSAKIKIEKTSSSAFGAPEASAKQAESEKNENIASGAGSTTAAASALNGSIFSFGNTVSSSPNNGSLGSIPSFPPSISKTPSDNSASQVPFTVQSFAPTPAASISFGQLPASTSSDSNSQSSSAPFKFGEPAAPFSAPKVAGSSDQIPKETDVKSSIFGNSNGVPFGDTASTDATTDNGFAAKSSDIKSTPSSMFGNSSASNNIFGGTSSVARESIINPSIPAYSPAVSSGSATFGVTASSNPGTETNKFSGSFAATTGNNIFGSSSPALTSSGSSLAGGAVTAASSQSQTSNLLSAANTQTNNAGSGTTLPATQTAPFQFGSSASAPSFGLSGNTALASSSPFGVSKSEPSLFGSSSTSQMGSLPTPATSSASSSATASSNLFGTNWQTSNSAPVFSSSFTPSSSPTFPFGGSSAATGSTAPAPAPIFGSSANTPSSSPIFGFTSTPAATQQQPVFGSSAPAMTSSQSLFGNSTPGFAFGASAQTNGNNNNEQVTMEDSMAEDTDQAKASTVPMFGQPSVSMPQPSFTFGGAPPTAAGATPQLGSNLFQFSGQPIVATPQNASPFQASQSLEFQGSGSFSLGSTGGGDKSGRRIFKAKKTQRKK